MLQVACAPTHSGSFILENATPDPIAATVTIYGQSHTTDHLEVGSLFSFAFTPGPDAHFHVRAKQLPDGPVHEEDLGYVTSGMNTHARVILSEEGFAYSIEK